MMGSEDNDAQETFLFTSTDAMESLDLDGDPGLHAPLAYISSSDYKSAMSSNASMDGYRYHSMISPYHCDPLQRKEGGFVGRAWKDSPQESSGTDDPLVEPPSYSDAILSSYEDEDEFVRNKRVRDVIHSSRFANFSSSCSGEGEFIHISVTQPQEEQELGSGLVGNGSFVTYLITTCTNILEYEGTDFSVRRRFRDVVALADGLAEAHRGYFVPPRPDKSVIEGQVMQRHDFIEQRAMSLENYFARLCRHRVIRRSAELRTFLCSPGKLALAPTTTSRMLGGTVSLPRQLFGEGSGVASSGGGGRDLFRIFKELKQSVSNDWGGGKPAIIEEDKDFLEKKARTTDLEWHLTAASKQAEAIVKAQQELGDTMGELGLAFVKLSKFESKEALGNPQRDHAVDAKRLATAAVKASRCSREANAQSVKHLDQLHEYLGLMQAVHTAFADRSHALLALQTIMSDISSANTKVEKHSAAVAKVFGGDKTRNRRIEELKEVIKVAEESRTFAMREYERIKENNRTELECFEQDRQIDFYEMIKGFVQNQVIYAEKTANVWAKVVAESANYHYAPQ